MLQYFDFDEFDSPDDAGSGLPVADGGKMCINFLHKLDKARDIAGVPFVINSAYRTAEHNQKVGGRVGSSHVKVPCKAVDISCRNSYTRTKILNALHAVGLGRRQGIDKVFIHVDDDTDKEDAIWLY